MICIAALMMAAAAALTLARSRRGVEIHMDDRTQVKMSRSKRGIRVEFVADDDPSRPSDAELYPYEQTRADVMMDSSSINRDFLRRLASFDSAAADEKESIVGLLLAKGIISKEEAAEWLFDDNGSAADGTADAADRDTDIELHEGEGDSENDYPEPEKDPAGPGYVIDEDDFGDF